MKQSAQRMQTSYTTSRDMTCKILEPQTESKLPDLSRLARAPDKPKRKWDEK